MNIQKTNKLGIAFAKSIFNGTSKLINDLIQHQAEIIEGSGLAFNVNLLRYNPRSKIIRVSKGIMDACRLIDIDSIKENIDEFNFDFKSMFILLDNDKSGIIKVERYGSDFYFLMFSNLHYYENNFRITYNSYSFIAKSFCVEKDDVRNNSLHNRGILRYEDSVFVVQLLTYLLFGEITEKHLPPKVKTKIGSTTFLNNSKLNITFCDSLWKQRINVDGFKVRGHFRLQACGEEWKKRKLIWIEEFDKQGYNRKSTVEIVGDKP